jgi:hypothetical protein
VESLFLTMKSQSKKGLHVLSKSIFALGVSIKNRILRLRLDRQNLPPPSLPVLLSIGSSDLLPLDWGNVGLRQGCMKLLQLLELRTELERKTTERQDLAGSP